MSAVHTEQQFTRSDLYRTLPPPHALEELSNAYDIEHPEFRSLGDALHAYRAPSPRYAPGIAEATVAVRRHGIIGDVLGEAQPRRAVVSHGRPATVSELRHSALMVFAHSLVPILLALGMAAIQGAPIQSVISFFVLGLSVSGAGLIATTPSNSGVIVRLLLVAAAATLAYEAFLFFAFVVRLG